MVNDGRVSFCLDVLAECAIRQNRLAEAQDIIAERLKRIGMPNIEGSVEWYLLFNNAMLQEKLGKSSEAETYYKKAIAQHEQDDKNRGAMPGSSIDNNRMLAYVLREYARFLRSQKRPSESYELMDRAVGIMNNGP
jgi:tetratricopeptide (TPR) repeat protein